MMGRRLVLSIGVFSLLALAGCMSKDVGTGQGGQEDSGYGGTTSPITPIDPNFGTDQDGQDSSALPPGSVDGSGVPGTTNSDGSPIGADFLYYPTPGRLPFDPLPNYNPRTPTFQNSNVLRYFFCIGLTPPYNTGVAVLQLLDKYNFLTAVALKTAGRLLTPQELRQLLRTVANVDDATSRSAAARRLLVGDFSDDHLFAEIDAQYRSFLGNRSPNADELAYWKNRLRNGTPFLTMVAEISTSDERRNRLGGRTVAAKIQNFIMAQYKNLLGRDASTRRTLRQGERVSELDRMYRFIQQRRRQGRTLPQAFRDFTDYLMGMAAFNNQPPTDEYLGIAATKVTKLILEDKATGPIIQAARDRLKNSGGDLFGVKEWLFGKQEFFDKFRRFFVQSLTREWCEQNASGFLQQWLGGGN